MTEKTPTGVNFFDREYSGTYKGRAMLASGRSGSGKSVFSLQFLHAGLSLQERCLLLSTRPAEDVALYTSAMGMPVDNHIESGNLVILEYSNIVPGQESEQDIMLPPEGFNQLEEIIQSYSIQRLALDTVLPWVSIPNADHIAEHVFSFVRAFRRVNVTSLFTLPNPVSSLAFRLRQSIQNVVPVSVLLLYEPESSRRRWVVNKYIGKPQTFGMEFDIQEGKGIVQKKSPTAPFEAPEANERKDSSEDKSPASSSDSQKGVRFADLIEYTQYRPLAH